MPWSDPVVAAFVLLRPRVPRLLLAVLLASASLCSALTLAAVSAWLITRAWEMPPVLDLAIAVVAVRALAISRGVFHYCGRLSSHDTALRAAGTAREQIYLRLASGPVDAVMRRRSGELVSRLGADVDELSDVLIRALLPMAVAVVLAVIATTVLAFFSPAAAAVLAVCLAVSGLVAPWLATRAALDQEHAAAEHHCDRDVSAMIALEHAAELRVSGQLPDLIAVSERAHRAWGASADRAAIPAAFAAAIPGAAIGISVLGAAIAAIAVAPSTAPTTVAVLMLLPLAAFEATTALPAAAVAMSRARIAARRLLDLAGPQAESSMSVASSPFPATPSATPPLTTVGLRAGYSGGGTGPFTLTLEPAGRTVVTGPSGCGKTALLMTLAGLLTPRNGCVRLDGHPLNSLVEADVRCHIAYFAEDAHLFDTSVRQNLLVARGDCTDEELHEALRKVGLDRWLAGLPTGLDTVLIGGATAVSAGQRRRLLLARALVSHARIVLLDEPTEHLDASDAAHLLEAMLDPDGGLFDAGQTLVVATHQRRGAMGAIDIGSTGQPPVPANGAPPSERPRSAIVATPSSIPRATASTSERCRSGR